MKDGTGFGMADNDGGPDFIDLAKQLTPRQVLQLIEKSGRYLVPVKSVQIFEVPAGQPLPIYDVENGVLRDSNNQQPIDYAQPGEFIVRGEYDLKLTAEQVARHIRPSAVEIGYFDFLDIDNAFLAYRCEEEVNISSGWGGMFVPATCWVCKAPKEDISPYQVIDLRNRHDFREMHADGSFSELEMTELPRYTRPSDAIAEHLTFRGLAVNFGGGYYFKKRCDYGEFFLDKQTNTLKVTFPGDVVEQCGYSSWLCTVPAPDWQNYYRAVPGHENLWARIGARVCCSPEEIYQAECDIRIPLHEGEKPRHIPAGSYVLITKSSNYVRQMSAKEFNDRHYYGYDAKTTQLLPLGYFWLDPRRTQGDSSR